MCTTVEGPHKRMAIWFQGCNIHCKECCNPELQPIKIAHIMTVSEIVDIAVNSKHDYGIEGVTFLGGEPTLQNHLHLLAHELKNHGLGIVLFTGKSINQLSSELINEVDIIVDGEFQSENIDTDRNLIGSKNQRIHFISNRYDNEIKWFYDVRSKIVEVNCGRDSIIISGDVI